MNPSTRAVISAAAAAAIAGSAYLGTRYLALAVFAMIVLAAIGWPVLLRVSRPLVSTAIIIGGGLLALVAVVLGASEPYLRYMVIPVAAMTVAAMIAELFWPSQPGRVVSSVAATAAAGVVAGSGAAWVAADRTPGSEDLVVAGAVAIAVASVTATATSNANINAALTLVFGTATGYGMGTLFDSISWYGGALVGATAGATALIVHELYRREPRPKGVWAGIASALTAVLVAGVLIYIGGRLLVG
jgi:hypothetical protein